MAKEFFTEKEVRELLVDMAYSAATVAKQIRLARMAAEGLRARSKDVEVLCEHMEHIYELIRHQDRKLSDVYDVFDAQVKEGEQANIH